MLSWLFIISWLRVRISLIQNLPNNRISIAIFPSSNIFVCFLARKDFPTCVLSDNYNYWRYVFFGMSVGFHHFSSTLFKRKKQENRGFQKFVSTLLSWFLLVSSLGPRIISNYMWTNCWASIDCFVMCAKWERIACFLRGYRRLEKTGSYFTCFFQNGQSEIPIVQSIPLLCDKYNVNCFCNSSLWKFGRSTRSFSRQKAQRVSCRRNWLHLCWPQNCASTPWGTSHLEFCSSKLPRPHDIFREVSIMIAYYFISLSAWEK